MIQEAMFAPATQGDMLPPEPPKPVVCAEPLGECVKCAEPATLRSPSGTLYCEAHGYCGAKRVHSTALGISIIPCGKSVENFVWNKRMGIWCCSCVG